MTRYLFFAFSECKDPGREDEYNEWYNTYHVPDMLEIPGMIINMVDYVHGEGEVEELVLKT